MNQAELEFKPLTLVDARKQMLKEAMDGIETECPCCTRYVKLYKRKLNSIMAFYLVCLYKNRKPGEPGELVDIRETLAWKSGTQRGDYAYLKHWGLIEDLPADRKVERSSSMWRITPKGIAFVMFRDTTVPSHVHILCGEVVGFSETQITIDKALGEKFSYPELMNS